MNTETLHTITEKQLVPQLRFTEFERVWEIVKFDKYCKFQQGVQVDVELQKTEPFEDYVRFLRIENYTQNSNDFRFIPNTYNESKIINENDIVVVRYGATAGFIGRGIDGVLANNLFKIIPNSSFFNNNYLFHYLKSYKAFHFFQTEMSGGAMPALSFGIVKALKIPLTEIPEQQKIASFLSSVDTKLQQLTQKKELLEQYKKGVMQQLFSQQLRFKQDDGSDYPDWEEKRIGDVLFERDIKKPKSEEYPLMAFMANRGVAPKGDRYNREFLVNDGNNKKYKQTKYGDFIYSSNNLETGSIGLNRYGNATISPVYSIFKIGESCEIEFMSNYLVRKEFINKMIRFRQGVVYGQWRIHESEFLKIIDKIPSKEEQQQIANYLSALDTKIESVAQQIDQTQQFKKGLLQQMFV